MSENIKERPLYRIISVAVSVLLAFSVIFCLTVTIQVLANGYASIMGFSVFRVVTGSMEPEIPVGTIIVTRRVSIESIIVDDIICFRSKSPEMLGKTITHRVIGRFYDESKNILLQTKGDFAQIPIDVFDFGNTLSVGSVILSPIGDGRNVKVLPWEHLFQYQEQKMLFLPMRQLIPYH